MDSKPQTDKIRSPTHEGSFNLVPTVTNPEWYRKMCGDFPRPGRGGQKKKPRTIVKRRHTLEVFHLLLKNRKSESKYASYIIDEAQRRLESYSPGEDDAVPF
jgi:hypothetical protein